jgi:hypothetical protein
VVRTTVLFAVLIVASGSVPSFPYTSAPAAVGTVRFLPGDWTGKVWDPPGMGGSWNSRTCCSASSRRAPVLVEILEDVHPVVVDLLVHLPRHAGTGEQLRLRHGPRLASAVRWGGRSVLEQLP